MSKSQEIQKKLYALDAEREKAVAGFKERAAKLSAELEKALAEEATDQEDS